MKPMTTIASRSMRSPVGSPSTLIRQGAATSMMRLPTIQRRRRGPSRLRMRLPLFPQDPGLISPHPPSAPPSTTLKERL
jgi:hypothetical protein